MKALQRYQKEDQAKSPCFLQSSEDKTTLTDGVLNDNDLDQLCSFGCYCVFLCALSITLCGPLLMF
ncbi:hypothetical protein VII00023_14171 [Vibrio ichthyoenteri ATCC 700023]|uniref:Uncharacterized protein n=1 Tax=Vibrio ichthyoenteri ATCC 700023 TaxID=870968 RepID=F9S284_9VIBR|nr:hypothetical protein VII00023_14171 [Vibrio ichthyoenteri ATCC 700023]